VPDDFLVPLPLRTSRFRFEALGPQHGEQDLAAWTQSIEHIRQTPGFAGRDWPAVVETSEQNLVSLERHRQEHEERSAFAYAVLDADGGDYLGCVYFSPPRTEEADVDVRSWVREERAELDGPLHDAVRTWLAVAWPWRRPAYAAR
jgi:hypothetical protein